MILFKSLTFYITGQPGEITPGCALWQMPLSGRSAEFVSQSEKKVSSNNKSCDWTVGDYFQAAREFICKADVTQALADAMGQNTPSCGQWKVGLHLEKHGAWYHPIRMTVSFKDDGAKNMETSFVLNGAVKEKGLDLVGQEAGLLSILESRFEFEVIPKVYTQGRIHTEKGDAGFFLGQWFDGFHEFHITGNPGSGKLVVWRPNQGDLELNLDQSCRIYENISEILTLAYDVTSGRQICPWHHAAGDFILDPENPQMPVRLITVRGYEDISDMDHGTAGPFPGLVVFLINLTLRMQLDRIDGVGEPVFLGGNVCRATLKGFFKGLRRHNDIEQDGFDFEFREFISQFNEEQILNVMIEMMAAWPPGVSEQDVISANIVSHCQALCSLFKSGESQDFY